MDVYLEYFQQFIVAVVEGVLLHYFKVAKSILLFDRSHIRMEMSNYHLTKIYYFKNNIIISIIQFGIFWVCPSSNEE